MIKSSYLIVLCALISLALPGAARTRPVTAPEALKVHGIFRSHMVLQRDEPITIWGWAPAGVGGGASTGSEVAVTFGEKSASGKAAGDGGRWEVVFAPQAARAASAKPQTLTVKTGNEIITMKDILIGDVWVMNGQSNMAFALKA